MADEKKKVVEPKTRVFQFIPSDDPKVDNIPPTVCTFQQAAGTIDGTTIPALTLMRKANVAGQYVIPASSPQWEKECKAMVDMAERYGMKELDMSKDKIGEIPERMRPQKPVDPLVEQLQGSVAERDAKLAEMAAEKEVLEKAMQELQAKLDAAEKKK